MLQTNFSDAVRVNSVWGAELDEDEDEVLRLLITILATRMIGHLHVFF